MGFEQVDSELEIFSGPWMYVDPLDIAAIFDFDRGVFGVVGVALANPGDDIVFLGVGVVEVEQFVEIR